MWFVFDFEPADQPMVVRLALEDGLVDLVADPGSPQPLHVSGVEVRQPADLNVERAEAIAQELSGVSVQDQAG
ncbi:hypothetical protein EV385_0477 [Krasilnikovia cinnamomea]|uniref:Uncharacterized protein n=1 Tax=Krasilnikovia cinnamomea TaxID=349313 RepID=A0A4Q7ZF54_9ACTN|nr:hypothetical protein [Krasilnikovia cinnamomea]RZU48753.1 hypothetical protein EV385_0477 [Krasilnikovia cinnamomea]